MAKNRNKKNRHAIADKVTCPYCDSEAVNMGFKHAYGRDLNGDFIELPGDYLYFCKSCFKPFINDIWNKPGGMGRRNKIGRNEKCPCGSGIKYKRCCVKNYQPLTAQQNTNDLVMK